jgi:protein-tyrosine phosphatase
MSHLTPNGGPRAGMVGSASRSPAVMTEPPFPSLARPQLDRRERFAAEESVDIHCHCLPGLDDGPTTMDDALAICRLLVADGITTVIATPHQLGGYEATNGADTVRAAVAGLSAALAVGGVPLRVLPGGDVRVDERLVERLAEGHVLTLADGGHFILLELPHESLVDLTRPVAELMAAGITPVLSHPERNGPLARRSDPVQPWLAAGMVMQVTAGSLLGQFGPIAERAGWQMIEQGLVSIIATDAHDVDRRPPSLRAASEAITGRLGHAVARRLCIENPLKVLRGDRSGWTLRRPPQTPRQPLPRPRRGLLGWFS